MELLIEKIKRDFELTKDAKYTVHIKIKPKPTPTDVDTIKTTIKKDTNKDLIWWPSAGCFTYNPEK